MFEIRVRSKVWVEAKGRPVLGPGRKELLLAIAREGSISKAARLQNMTYRKAWGQIRAMENRLGLSLVIRQAGGVGGGGARLTFEARDFLSRYDRLIEGIEEQVNQKFAVFFHVAR